MKIYLLFIVICWICDITICDLNPIHTQDNINMNKFNKRFIDHDKQPLKGDKYHLIRKRGLNPVCQSTWDTFVYKFNVTLSWTVSDIDTSQIDHFRITMFRYSDNTLVSPPESLFTIVDGQNGQNSYNYTDNNRKPYLSKGRYSIEIYWKQSGQSIADDCKISLEPPPPSRIAVINVDSHPLIVDTAEELHKTFTQVHNLLINWVAPESPNAKLSDLQYLIYVGVDESPPVNENSDYIHTVENVTLKNETLYSGRLIESNVMLVPSTFTHLYIKLRSFYQVEIGNELRNISSNWSNTVNLTRFDEGMNNPTLSPSLLSDPSFLPPLLSPSHSLSLLPTASISSSPTHSAVSPLPTINMDTSDLMIITTMPLLFTGVIIVIVGLTLCIVYILAVKNKRRFAKMSHEMEKDTNDELRYIFIENIKTSSELSTNTYTSFHDNHDKWEVPAECVVTHQCLGEGSFGKVYEGVIRGHTSQPLDSYLRQSYDNHHVAVKKLKKNVTSGDKDAFLKEIELMKKIAEGNNPHVVNMIGAVTLQEPMLLVLEFMKYGDLLNYLRACKKQVDLVDNKLTDVYMELGLIDSVDYFSFAYQISSGMEYLASMNVVHRDLACRNVLVGRGKKLKITDFGMSRKLKFDSVYVMNIKVPLPVKWMALESIINLEFTTASDVWSFGVTMWEIATLGQSPYPIIDNENLVLSLKRGHRMQKPNNCSEEIYQIMLDCWKEQPQHRPTFTDLRQQFDKMITKQKDTSQIYIELVTDNSQYIS